MAIKKEIYDQGSDLYQLVDDSGEHKVKSVVLNHEGDVYKYNDTLPMNIIGGEDFLAMADMSDAMRREIISAHKGRGIAR